MSEALSAGTVSLGVKPDTAGFGSKLAAGIRGESSGLGGLGKELGGQLLAGLGAVGIAVGVGEFIKKGIEEYSAADALNAQFAAGMKSTNNAAGLSVKGMDDLAAAVSGYSGQAYSSIGKTEQVLQTFVNIKNVGPNKIFDEATTAAANMAAKLGGDASSSAIQLGKALNDPVMGMAALRRVGVAFTASQADQIKAMVASGDVMGAQKVMLGELNTEFGGAAKAAGQTLPGELARSNVAFGEISKSIISGIIPVVLPTITKIASALAAAAPKAEELGKEIASKLVPAFSGLVSFMKTYGKELLIVGAAVAAAVIGLKAYEAITNLVKIASEAWGVAQAILNVIMDANPISIIIIAIAGLVAGIIWVATQTHFFQDAWKVMTDIVGGAWNWLWGTIIKPVVDFIVGYFKMLGSIVTWLWVNIVQPVAKWIGDAITVVGDVIGKVFGAVGGIIKGAFNGVVDFVKGIFNTIIDVVNGIIHGINAATSIGAAIGIHIGKIPNLPHLADSGTVLPTPGGTIVRVAEGGKAESVVDTGQLNNLMRAATNAATKNLSAGPEKPHSIDIASIAPAARTALAQAIVQQTRLASRMG